MSKPANSKLSKSNLLFVINKWFASGTLGLWISLFAQDKDYQQHSGSWYGVRTEYTKEQHPCLGEMVKWVSCKKKRDKQAEEAVQWLTDMVLVHDSWRWFLKMAGIGSFGVTGLTVVFSPLSRILLRWRNQGVQRWLMGKKNRARQEGMK